MSNITMILTNPFDPDIRVLKEALYLNEKGHSVKILCWDRTPQNNLPENDNYEGIGVKRFKIHSIPGSGKKQINSFIKFIKYVKRYLKRNPADYIHCHDIDGAIVGYFSKKYCKHFIFDMHEFYEDYGKKTRFTISFYRRLTIFFIRRSKYSLYENNLYLGPKYKKVQNKLLPLRNYPYSKMLQRENKTNSKIFRIGYFGALRSQIKEFTTLFESVKNMNDVIVNIHGGGPDLEKLIEISKNYNNVKIHGPFNGATELTNLYKNTDIVYAGYMTNSKSCECDEMVKFFECIYTGTPLIITKCYTLMSSQVVNDIYGVACDTLSIKEVTAAILKLKNDKAFYKKCVESEIKNSAKFSWDDAVKILDIVYDE